MVNIVSSLLLAPLVYSASVTEVPNRSAPETMLSRFSRSQATDRRLNTAEEKCRSHANTFNKLGTIVQFVEGHIRAILLRQIPAAIGDCKSLPKDHKYKNKCLNPPPIAGQAWPIPVMGFMYAKWIQHSPFKTSAATVECRHDEFGVPHLYLNIEFSVEHFAVAMTAGQGNDVIFDDKCDGKDGSTCALEVEDGTVNLSIRLGCTKDSSHLIIEVPRNGLDFSKPMILSLPRFDKADMTSFVEKLIFEATGAIKIPLVNWFGIAEAICSLN